MVTSLCFGGDDLRDLYIVTGSRGGPSESCGTVYRMRSDVAGHPFVDVWQAVKPAKLGLQSWPHVPRGTDIKHGTCAALGWPHRDQADIARAWKHILSKVTSYADLEPSLLGRVEELIDFVTT